MSRFALCCATLAATACASSQTPAPAPQQLALAALLDLAEQNQPYVASPNPATQIPMSAVITPPGMDFYFQSPPFTTVAKKNTGTQPVLNLIPGFVEGRFTTYVTAELWTNDYGAIWYNPIYRFTQDNGSGGPTLDPKTGQVVQLSGDVYTVAPPDRFYSPYWELDYVIVPPAAAAALTAHPPKSVRAALDLNYPIVNGPNGTWSVIPGNVALDPALQVSAPDPTDPTTRLPSWMKVIVKAEYATTPWGKIGPPRIRTSTATNAAWFEGKNISTMFFAVNDFVDEPGNIVQSTPLFTFVSKHSDGSVEPLDLPNVMGHGPLFSNSAVTLPGGIPNWDAAWEIYQVVVPASAQPFYPQVTDPDDPTNTDVFAGLRQAHGATVPDPSVSGIANIARYAGRLALNPACFQDATGAAADAAMWVREYRFLDSQTAIEGAIIPDNVLETETQALCPLMFWATPRP